MGMKIRILALRAAVWVRVFGMIVASVTSLHAVGAALQGTAFAVGDGYTLITNAHVISGKKHICLYSRGATPAKATVFDIRKSDDLAILRSNTYYPPLVLAQPEDLVRGSEMAVFGYPLIFEMGPDQKVTSGIVNSLSGGGGDSRYFQISAPVQPGNSGGPAISQTGTVIGVVTMRLDSAAGSDVSVDSVAYALKIPQVIALLQSHPETQLFDSPRWDSAASRQESLHLKDIVEKVEGSVVLVVAFDSHVTCADDFDVAVPPFGQTPTPREEMRLIFDRAKIEAKALAEARIEEERRQAEQARIEAEEEARIAAVLAEERAANEAAEAKLRLVKEAAAARKQAEKEQTEREQLLLLRSELDRVNKAWRLIQASPGYAAYSLMNRGGQPLPLDFHGTIADATQALADYHEFLVDEKYMPRRTTIANITPETGLKGVGEVTDRYSSLGYFIVTFSKLEQPIKGLVYQFGGKWRVEIPSSVVGSSASCVSDNLPPVGFEVFAF